MQMIVIYVRKQEAGSRNHEHLTGIGGTVVLSSGIKVNISAWPQNAALCDSHATPTRELACPYPYIKAECNNTMGATVK